MNESETRAELIDPALKAAGWGVVEGSRILREYRITEGRIEGRGRRGKADIADYVLVYRNTKLAVVEASNEPKSALPVGGRVGHWQTGSSENRALQKRPPVVPTG